MGILAKLCGLWSGDPLWNEIVAAHNLKAVEGSRDNRVEGRVGTSRVVLGHLRKKRHWDLTVGEPTDSDAEEYIELERRPEDYEIDPEEDLAQVPGLAGTDLARHYMFAVHPASENYSSLSLPIVREGLPPLAKEIASVQFHPAGHSLVLVLQRSGLTRESFDSALNWSVEAAKALGG